MNLQVLKKAEKKFLKKYPGGFQHSEMVEISKKHKMDQFAEFAKNSFSKSNFENSTEIIPNLIKTITRSTMISMFEKPKFRDTVQKFNTAQKNTLIEAYYEILHGKEQHGFELLLKQLAPYKLSKWSLMTIVQAYYKPNKEIFIKPTTTKMIIKHLELDLNYQPTPSWDFYKKYRAEIKKMKPQVDKSLSPSNPAFSGFLMMTLEE